MSSWNSYPKIYNVGHAALRGLLPGVFIVEEKVDGSQISFGVIDDVLRVRSKGVELNLDAPEQMFKLAVEQIRSIAPMLTKGYTYRGEYLQKPKHNTLTYSRVPQKNIIIFDIAYAENSYLDYAEKKQEAERLGLETVRLLRHGRIERSEDLLELMTLESALGGPTIEGVVLKQYNVFGQDAKPLFGKFVSEAFKEHNKVDFRSRNPSGGDIKYMLGEKYCSERRWEKAVEYLRDSGKIQNDPKDIGALLSRVKQDIQEECAEEIKTALYNWAKDTILRMSVRGLPQWYKEKLLKDSFQETVDTEVASHSTQ